MKRVWVACLGLLLAQAAAAADKAWQVGNWEGQEFTGESGEFLFCAMHGYYQTGVSLIFYFYPDGDLEMQLAHDAWKIAPNQNYPVKVIINGKTFPATAVSSPQRGDNVVIDLPDTEAMFAALRSGGGMSVTTPGETFQFSLADTPRALSRLIECTMAHVRSTTSNPFAAGTASSNPFAGSGSAANPPARGGSSANPFASSQQAAVPRQSPSGSEPTFREEVEGLLTDRRLAGFRTLPDDTGSDYEIWWVGPQGSAGAVIGLDDSMTADQYLADTLGKATGVCGGDFGSSRSKSALPNREIVSTLALYCRTASGEDVVIYSLYPMPWGFVATETRAHSRAIARDMNQRLFDAIADAKARG